MERTLILKTGQEYAIREESGKYYVCEDGTRFRKANPDIAEIKEMKGSKKKKEEEWGNVPEEELILEESTNKASAKKTNKKTASKKKGEDK